MSPGVIGTRIDDPDVGRWILNRIASSRIADWIGHLKQSGGPLLRQMLKINHLLTLRSPNANDLEKIRSTTSAAATQRSRSLCRPILPFVRVPGWRFALRPSYAE